MAGRTRGLAVLSVVLSACGPAVELAAPAGVPEGAVLEEPSPQRRAADIGIHAGYVLLGRAGGPSFENGPAADLRIRFTRGESSRTSTELGVGAALFTEADGAGGRFVFIMERLEFLFRLGSPPRYRVYLLAGGEAIQEIIVDSAGEPSQDNYSGAARIGAGVALLSGRVDVRATHDFLFLSGNLGSKTTFGVGFFF